MARLILDTTVLIDAERPGQRLDRLIHDDDDVAIAAITAAELLVGVELATGRRRPARAAFVQSVLDTIPIEDYDARVGRTHAGLLAHVRRSGSPRVAHDLIIAATAAAHDRLVVSADHTAFVDLPGVGLRT
ncbi:MAG TPA: PIN domain-containing protein [Mycobacteriales bacterium]|nr:PIN domain-containing protein [Mycobacteriales bacterium]